MNQNERTELKWRLLMEKCDIRLQVLGPTYAFPRALYNILSIERVRDIDADAISGANSSDVSGF